MCLTTVIFEENSNDTEITWRMAKADRFIGRNVVQPNMLGDGEVP